MPRQHTAERENVAGIVVDKQCGLADKILIGIVEFLEHSLLLDWQFRDHTM
jgi:hypothetical protein